MVVESTPEKLHCVLVFFDLGVLCGILHWSRSFSFFLTFHMSEQEYVVPRPFAAELLNVSLRTLDRYVRRKHISSVRKGRQLYFSEQEILAFKAEAMALESVQQAKRQQEQAREQVASRDEYWKTRQTMGRQGNDFIDVQMAQEREAGDAVGFGESPDEDVRVLLSQDSLEARVYRKLYDSARGQLVETREELNRARMVLVKLQEKMRRSISPHRFHKQGRFLLQMASTTQRLEKKALLLHTKLKLSTHQRDREAQSFLTRQDAAERHVGEMRRLLVVERVSRMVFAVLLFLLASLIPLAMIARLVG